MENLRITDSGGDSFTLLGPDDGFAAIVMDSASSSDCVYLSESDARRMVDWLTERFELTRELETLAGDVFTIDVETGTGARRTVTWDGPNVPAALIELAHVALGLGERARVQTDHDCAYWHTMVKIRDLVNTLGLRQQVGAYDAVAALVKAHRELRRDFASVVAGPKQPIELMVECGGATTEAQALETLRGWKGQIDAAVSQLRGLLPGDTATDVPTLVRHLIAQHNGRYTQLREQQEAARAEYDRAMIDNNERGLAREREARAQVQAKLDIAREALRSVRMASTPVHIDVLNVVKGALKNTEPESASAYSVQREVLQDMLAELSDEENGPSASNTGVAQIPNSVVATWHRRIKAALEGRDPNA